MNTTNGIGSINALASATAQRIPTIKAGLEWLDRSGYVSLISIKGDKVVLKAGIGQNNQGVIVETTQLTSLLTESAAFRRYYLTANKDLLVSMQKES
jgi:hypothetical protein